jgi:hypothetical protein
MVERIRIERAGAAAQSSDRVRPNASKESKMKPAKFLTIAAALAVMVATPAWAAAGGVPTTHTPNPHAKHGSPLPGPGASLPAKAKAYGVYCDKESRKHVAGQKGTPFSQCVTAMAKLATGSTTSPSKACAGLSKKHVAGQKGTPYSQCVSAAARLKKATKH